MLSMADQSSEWYYKRGGKIPRVYKLILICYQVDDFEQYYILEKTDHPEEHHEGSEHHTDSLIEHDDVRYNMFSKKSSKEVKQLTHKLHEI